MIQKIIAVFKLSFRRFTAVFLPSFVIFSSFSVVWFYDFPYFIIMILNCRNDIVIRFHK